MKNLHSLYEELIAATCECPITKNKYIPAQKLSEIITVTRVNEALRSKRRWRRLLFRNRGLDDKVQQTRKLIAIIALIGKLNEDSLKTLTANGITDNRLPLSGGDDVLQNSLRNKAAWEDANIGAFLEKQWTVLAPILDLKEGHMADIRLDEKCALEFSQCEHKETTQFSNVYFAEIRSEEIGGKPCRVAVKKFFQDAFKHYHQERENLQRISSIDNNHLIKHLATCEQIPCIVFPWAERGDLNAFWEEESTSERNLHLVVWSLEQLAGLVSGLRDLHGENCRHGDLKPSNILCFKENDAGILKISDLGVSRLHNKPTDLRAGETVTKASTRAYEGPEAHRPEQTKAPRSRTYDCWSMGCIMLEFVIWLLYDYNALECFHGARDSEWNSYYRPKSPKPMSDGVEVMWWEEMERHPRVDEAIQLLREDVRVRGAALEELVDLVDLNLLMVNPKDRLLAVGIDEELQGILDRCRKLQTPWVNEVGDAGRPAKPEIFSQPPPMGPGTTFQVNGETFE
ncbi:kinase-like domain-containing protein [Thelonectria olida]|uniref:Kinase-like domain-containing protein n=1 Tax=Thelonectria olida TaxID=1576542 RepID=A0A9P8W4T8_9HYPO|nr:kinase-like domain-containing protein [Thelonectria olida]